MIGKPHRGIPTPHTHIFGGTDISPKGAFQSKKRSDREATPGEYPKGW